MQVDECIGIRFELGDLEAHYTTRLQVGQRNAQHSLLSFPSARDELTIWNITKL